MIMTKLTLIDTFNLIKLESIKKKSIAKKRKVAAILNLAALNFTGINYMQSVIGKETCENNDGHSYECVIHAEEKTIMQALKVFNLLELRDNETTMYVTYSPCINCAKLIVHSQINRLIYIDQHKSNFTEPKIKNGISVYDYLIKSGVEVIRVENYDINKFRPIKIN